MPRRIIPTPRLMPNRGYQPRLNREASPIALIGIPAASVMIGSLTPLLPFVATSPILPPFGLITLIAWRMLVRDLWPVWAALPLGLFDDMFSGQPLGSAMLIWTLVFLVIDLFDRGMMWRDYRQDWGIAGGLIAVALAMGLAVANMTGGETVLANIAPQAIVSILSYPIVVRICAALDRLRWLV